MPKITNFSQVDDVLKTYIPDVKQFTGKDITLERMLPLMQVLRNPQNQLKVIHIAGTSGKTSTAYYVSALLRQTGKNVGLTVSPHIDNVAERVQINGQPLTEEVFSTELSEFLDLIHPVQPQPTYFELLVAFAYWAFDRQKLDYAVVETGMGGLHDGTNVAQREDKVCVITDIDYDHTEILGKTLPEIASQKAGIIHQHNVVFTFKQDEEIMQTVRQQAQKQHAQLHEVLPEKLKAAQNLPLFQQRNWQLANEVVEYVIERDGLVQLSDSQLLASTKTYIPARMEIVKKINKTLIIDGSHNGQKIRTLGESIKDQYPDQKIAALVSFVESDQDRTKGAVKEILKLADDLIITSFSGEQDTPKHSVDPQIVANYCKQLGFNSCRVIDDPETAYQELLTQPEPILLITGSFYLLNHIRPLIFHSE